jgi:hypothetical protein
MAVGDSGLSIDPSPSPDGCRIIDNLSYRTY